MGVDFDFAQGHCSISSYIGHGYIEMAWSSHIKGSDFNRIMAQVRDYPDATTEVIESPNSNANRRMFFGPMEDRYEYVRLFQDINFNQNKIELHDIAIKLEIVLYHRQGIKDTFDLPQDQGNIARITPVISELLKLKFYVIEICDHPTAEQRNPGIGDILLDRDMHNVQFHEYINPILEYKEDISCHGCKFQTHIIEFCVDFNKMKVCKFENDDRNAATTFNKGNLALIIIVDYFDQMYKFKRARGDANAIKLGENFSKVRSDSGIPLFVTSFRMKTTWKPDFDSSNPIASFMELVEKCCKKNEDEKMGDANKEKEN
ncbi:6899_t:CDS:2 [Cetraspora pellucida]|uniref:6899_t:CDS:1 n=1 Tax=Cetraspora pellucida TaxID=1433469 RepID=A0A9N8YY46_9GLOM|nr:6899_t:CDS:2 [Cetraspora pellucida]